MRNIRIKDKRTLNAKLDSWSLLIITVIIASIALCINLVSNALLRSNALKYSHQRLNFVASQIHTLTKKVEDESLFFITEESEKLKYDSLENASMYEQMLYRDSVSRQLRIFFNAQLNLISVAFYDRNGLYFYRDKELEQVSSEPPEMIEVLNAFIESDQQSMWQLLPGAETGQFVFALLNRTFNINGVYRGIFVLKVNPSVFFEIYNGTFSEETEVIILNSEGRICFSSLDSEQTDLYKTALLAHTSSDGEPFRIGRGFLALNLSVDDLGLHVFTIISENALYKSSHILVVITIIIGFCTAFLSRIILGYTTKKLLAPLGDIVDKVQQLSEGNYAARIAPYSSDELASLSVQINQMAQNTQNLVEQIRQKGELRKKYEIEYLQLQMQPHFLYNALETINGMIAVGEQLCAVKMIDHLSKFYRDVLNYGEAIITIEKELEIATNYLAIMKNRYHSRFSFKFQAQEQVLQYHIPKLTLQPLLENSIMHGFRGTNLQGTIFVRANLVDGVIVLEVEDNGRGFIQLDTAVQQEPDTLTYFSFGLRSVEERLRLYYGNNVRLSVTSELGRGTCVSLYLPVEINS